jgi:ureidoacrylate peracid hydrolase
MIDLGNNPALIVVDMQNGFCHAEGSMHKSGLDHTACATAISSISLLVEAWRAAELPVVWTRYSLRADYADAGRLFDLFPGMKEAGAIVEDTWDAALVDEFQPLPDELLVDKTRYSAFHRTDLADRLRAMGTDTIVVCGVTTNICVEGTVRDGFALDFHIILVEDATGAVTPDLHEGALRNVTYGFGQVKLVSEIIESVKPQFKLAEKGQ